MTDLFETEYQGYTTGVVVDAASMRFNIYIQSWAGCHGPDQRTEKVWLDLNFAQVSKYRWFFRYYAAKLQMESPRRVYGFLMERTLNEQDERKAAINRLINKQRSAKAKITEVTGKLDKARANWNSLFPIEDEENYKKAMAYLFQKRQAIQDFQAEIDQLLNQPTPAL